MGAYLRGKSWYFEFQVRGECYKGSIGKVSRKVAEEVADKKRIEVLEGKLLVRPKKSPAFGQHLDATDIEPLKQFTGVAGEYWKYYHSGPPAKSIVRTRNSLMHLCKQFGNLRLTEIHPFRIEKYKIERLQAGTAEATVNRELACLKNLFNQAINWSWADSDPVCKVKLFVENNVRDRFLTQEEEGELLKHCLGRLYLFVVIGLDTGFRAGHIATIRWKDVDLQRREIGAPGRLTKNGEPLRNPLTKRLTELLTILKGKGKVSPDAPVIGAYCYNETFKRARTAAGLAKDVVFHTMRHTFISRLVMAGVNLRTVQELAGHKTMAMTMRYAHLAPHDKRRAIDILEAGVPQKSPQGKMKTM